jgi:type II secretory pathway pseudopilin PulG
MSSDSDRRSEAGFTLAAVIVIFTIVAIVVTYTVPQMWSDVMRRERDYETMFVMKQYARAITEFQRRRGTYPTSLDQLKEQNRPRVIRQMYTNPLSGEMDWILVPFGTESGGAPPPGLQPPPGQGDQPGNPPPTPPGVDSKAGGSGPFIGVRPPQTGPSIVSFNDKTTYETWIYTTNDLQRDMAGAPPPPPTGPPPVK